MASGPIVVVTYGLIVASEGRACAQTIVVRVSDGHIVAFSCGIMVAVSQGLIAVFKA